MTCSSSIVRRGAARDAAVQSPAGSTGCPSRAPRGEPSLALLVAVTLFVWVGLVFARWSAPSDLMVRDQARVGAYVLDIVHNGNVLLQRDVQGNVASKPPMFNWLAALATVVGGELSRLSLGFPSALATLLAMLLLLATTIRGLGRDVALWVVPLFAFSMLGLRQVFLIRTDALFAFFVFATCIATYRAWQRGRGWEAVGLCAALATMTKGPHGVLFAVVGLAAAWWEKRSGTPLPVRGRIWRGVVLFLTIPVAWLLLAWASHGQAVVDKLFVDELVGHALGIGQGEQTSPGRKFGHPWAWFLTRLAPMGLIASVGLWRVLRRPAQRIEDRRFERFLFCWTVGGLLLLSVQSTVRFIHLLPVMPPAAMLAGREIASWLRDWPARRRGALAVATAVIGVVMSWLYLNVFNAQSQDILESERLRLAARDIAARYDVERLQFAGAPMALQLHLQVFRQELGAETAMTLLAGAEPVLMATLYESGEALVDAPRVHRRYPLSEDMELLIVGNSEIPAGGEGDVK